ncbi:Probable dicarboxylic acid transport integral membrane protein KgtP [Mycobacteroides abscessus subsp. massiliense]|uniref:Alpha-ketoglutarate permease n=2 Tax=Mycobacteroides abscessus TaxID=36809 RepID=X8DIU1_9MYCO|nr:MFS transporter [Mycobacteroides abscessus]EUA67375.1 sugar (and other) transporter family protein [Mycobacteroides abscessus subsp. bolletii 1513]AMU32335.1 alpha-ketoglutarate transporter [Mycobacteroides abscessus]ANO00512.1 alpha-ketoglutarate transporter [Mycobacteroides abscessus]EHM15307.1 dicarboxylic acid transport integral membrane protein KgtP [Mycobacteroides abscessus subsp. massiliense CCUG 48898 = JCM 15300]EIU05323.1 putative DICARBOXYLIC ACID TRANSPORT INTEGRAL MEMBRANE PRO
MTVSAADTSAPSGRAQTRRAIWNTIRGSSGNLVEWYDVYVYTVFALYFEKQFFDDSDQNSTVYVYAIFAVTFITRPLGSWFFGRFADRNGRRAALTLSVSLMAACSMVIALVPSRSSIGMAAPIVLILCRLVQGFATGGEYGTSATYMSEAATRERRGFFSSFQYVTLVGGHVLAQFTLLIILTVFDTAQVHEFGWRIAFAMGGVAAIVVYWLRRTMDESLSEEQLAAIKTGADTSSGSMRELLIRYWKPLLLCFLITMGGTLAFYTYSVNAPAIVKAAYKDQAMTATWINLAGLIFLMLLQPVGGIISDKVGRKPLLLFFGFGGVMYTYVLITYLPQVHAPIVSFLLVAVSYVLLTGYTSINALVKSELFPSHVRALGVGVGYALANSVFGGTAPLIYQALKEHDQVPLFIGYVTVCIAISLVVYLFFLENKSQTYLDREQGSAFNR